QINDREQSLSLPIMVGTQGFNVERKYNPAYFLRVQYEPGVPRIEYSITRPIWPGLGSCEEKGTVGFHLQQNAEVVFNKDGAAATVEDLSITLLSTAIAGFASPLE